MTRTDRKILFTALAFFAVAAKGKGAERAEAAAQIHRLADLVESFCARSVGHVPTLAANEVDASFLDEMIERYIGELREKEETRLPEDRATLINVYDRLLQRKARWKHREFYSDAADQQIADDVLKLLDEEINDVSRAKLA